ncbi:MAG: ATP synthase F1 subunit delta [Candidatus Aureabacteria bacterium]|nr:ATP synthase F1 subunit delta [Candidatus Auribacterota bacterium]
MLSYTTVKRYALGLLEAVKHTKNPEEILQELKSVSSFFKKVDGLNEFLDCPKIPPEEKVKALGLLFKKRPLSSMTENVLRLLFQNHRLPLLEQIIRECEILFLEKQGKINALITTVIDLHPQEKKQLVSFLESRLQKKVEPEFEKDQQIIAGIKIRVEDQVWDGSVRKTLQNLETDLIEGN